MQLTVPFAALLYSEGTYCTWLFKQEPHPAPQPLVHLHSKIEIQ